MGGSKKYQQQREMATDLSKFLYFTGGEICIQKVASFKAVEAYVKELHDRKVGPSGIIAKLNVISFAQAFLIHRYD